MKQTRDHALNIVIAGLSITSSWGNGHATTYRALVRELSRRGNVVTFFERDVPWYASNRDLPELPQGKLVIYSSLDELQRNHQDAFRKADAVILGSYVPEGATVGE
jgi:spore maturation protein CgeB